MQINAKSIPIWFVAAFVPMVLSQLARLQQTTASGWLLCDYSGRIGALLLLAAIPSARAVAYRRQSVRTSWWETGLWIVGLPVLFCTFCHWISHVVNRLIPHTSLGYYYPPHGWLHLFDLTLGLALVSFHEEVIFRRCAREIFPSFCGNGTRLVIFSAILFAAYHWTTGLGNIIATFIFGVGAMIGFRRTEALWPMVAAHFLTDFFRFAGIF
jgi:membrane protease YdiL (CAAX protease family)